MTTVLGTVSQSVAARRVATRRVALRVAARRVAARHVAARRVVARRVGMALAAGLSLVCGRRRTRRRGGSWAWGVRRRGRRACAASGCRCSTRRRMVLRLLVLMACIRHLRRPWSAPAWPYSTVCLARWAATRRRRGVAWWRSWRCCATCSSPRQTALAAPTALAAAAAAAAVLGLATAAGVVLRLAAVAAMLRVAAVLWLAAAAMLVPRSRAHPRPHHWPRSTRRSLVWAAQWAWEARRTRLARPARFARWSRRARLARLARLWRCGGRLRTAVRCCVRRVRRRCCSRRGGCARCGATFVRPRR